MKYLKSYADEDLVGLYLSGRAECLDILIERHRNRIFSYIIMNVRRRDVADDIFQEAIIRVFLSLRAGRYSSKGKFLSWVIRIAHNLIVDGYRRSRHRQMVYNDATPIELFVDDEHLADTSRENQLVEQQQLVELTDMVHSLPDTQRQVIEMRHYREMSFKEIAEETDVSINTALGRMRYGLINLRRMMVERNSVCV